MAECMVTETRVYSDKQTNNLTENPELSVMNEKCFGTATTPSRIHAEINGVSGSSYTCPIDQNISYHARLTSDVLTS